MTKTCSEQLKQKGAIFYEWNPPRAKKGLLSHDEVLVRLVTSFATETDQIDLFLKNLG